mmetsp:Transcript_40451/g.99916  ORF Transcript_40451/g.99916 Transcript_40451/m.99916 type:complete len:563 (+) Transcript_40451:96-1784(+)
MDCGSALGARLAANDRDSIWTHDDDQCDETSAFVGGGDSARRRFDEQRWPRLARSCAALLAGGVAALAVGLVLAYGTSDARLDSVALQSPTLATAVTIITFSPPGHAAKQMRKDRSGWPRSGEEGVRAYEENWRCYAALHGHSLFIERQDTGAFPSSDTGLRGAELAHAAAQPGAPNMSVLSQPNKYTPHWMRLLLFERFLPHASWVVWIDADALFLSLPNSLSSVLDRAAGPANDLVVFANFASQDPSGEFERSVLCSCVFAVRNTPGGFWFIRRWWALRGKAPPANDQSAFHHVVLEMHLRYAASLSAGPSAPPWHVRIYDSTISPCLHAHWALTEAKPDLRCITFAFKRLSSHGGLPALDQRTAWPVAWSTELAGQFLTTNVAGVGASWVRNLTRWWPLVEKTIGNNIFREGAPAGSEPRLIAHSKTGFTSPFMTMYHRSLLPTLVRECPAFLGCLDASQFLKGAFLGRTPQAWRPPILNTTAQCNGRRGGARLRGVWCRLAAACRVLTHVGVEWLLRLLGLRGLELDAAGRGAGAIESLPAASAAVSLRQSSGAVTST